MHSKLVVMLHARLAQNRDWPRQDSGGRVLRVWDLGTRDKVGIRP